MPKLILKLEPIEVANQSITLQIPGEEIIEVAGQALRLQLPSGRVLETAGRAKSINGVPMIGLTDFVKGARRVRRAQVRKEVRKLPGVKEVNGVFMLPVTDAAEMLTEHGEHSGAIKMIEALIN